MKVCKFGGSSLGNCKQIKKVKDIVLSDDERRYVVVSAPGKCDGCKEKITDLLIRYSEGEDTADIIKNRFTDIADSLELKINLAAEFYKIFNFPHEKDYIISRGEYLCAVILAEYIGYDFVDAKDIIIFSSGQIDELATASRVADMTSKHKKAVIGGFYGSENGKIKVFDRGGSDITGAIIAQKTACDVYENWTDVDGVMSASPRIVENPHVIETITYRELRELCCMGATVLHEDALIPVKRAKIPVNIRNTNNPSFKGTLIVNSRKKPSGYGIVGISGNKDGKICIVSESISLALPKILKVLGGDFISLEKPDSDTVLYLDVGKDRVNEVICSLYSVFFR